MGYKRWVAGLVALLLTPVPASAVAEPALDDVPKQVTASWADLGITGKASVRDIWNDRNLGRTDGISTVVTAGVNTVKFANPNDYAPDIDRITV